MIISSAKDRAGVLVWLVGLSQVCSSQPWALLREVKGIIR